MSEANRSGYDHPAPRSAAINPRSLIGMEVGSIGLGNIGAPASKNLFQYGQRLIRDRWARCARR
ncbi:MAG: hypothetical protein F4017_11590 [Acidimicrobiaceae bacterium]|nr:hypothetical protein [Acidimicrobiaceae bacterium]MYJ82117.1 hypothetical protein [Acidimicrobiaceae bacterium]MYK75209.1 hypothetical protein [Acidimicrobiaceae bacterium]